VSLLKDLDYGPLDSGTLDEGEAPARRVVVNREHPPSQIAVITRAADGTKLGRWAEDEAKVENVLGNATKTGDMPGGHGESGMSLARDPSQSYPDTSLFSTLEWLGAGGERLWQGTLRQVLESGGERIAIEPKALGNKQLLEDDETVIGPGFINVDQTVWTGPSAQRKINNSSAAEAGGYSFDQTPSPSVDTDPGGNSIISLVSTGKLNRPIWLMMFDAGSGIRIGAVAGSVAPVNMAPTSSEPFTLAEMYAADDDLLVSGLTPLGDVSAGGGFSYQVASQRVVAFQGQYTFTEPGGEEGKEYGYRFAEMIVIGDHGLTLQGAWPNVGFLAKQMVPIIAALAGLKTNPELLDDDDFVIPQAWFGTPGTPMSKLVEILKYGLMDWFVFNDRTLQVRVPRSYGRNWRLAPGSGAPKNSGQDAMRVWDRYMVQWSDVDGTTERAGVFGSGADYLSAELGTTDSRNAAVAAGLPRGKLLALNGVCTEVQAIRTATRFKEEAEQLAQSGESTITGYCQDDNGIWWPAAYVQPGDWAADPGTRNYRKITSVNYTHDSKSAGITLGAPPEGLGAIEARYNARLIELGFGS
jgi:hypothetical protein